MNVTAFKRRKEFGKTLASDIAHRMRTEIVTCRLKPGEVLKFDTLRLAYGATLLVPATSASVSAVADPVDAFGTDLDLAGGELAADANGDFALISGRDNLKQAIGSRIETPLRTLLFHLDYGCGVDRLKGGGNGPTSGVLGAKYVRSALRSDRRIASVLSATATITGAATVIQSTVQPVTGAPLQTTSAF